MTPCSDAFVPDKGSPRSSEGGYTLFLVLELLILIALLFTVTLQEIYYAKSQAGRAIQRVQARLLAESGITRAEYFLGGGDGHDIFWESDASDDTIPAYGNIHLECKRFGLFAKLLSKGTKVRATCAITALAARTPPCICQPVLTLSGKVGSLALMPGSQIKGTVILSHGRICKGTSTMGVTDPGIAVQIRESAGLPVDSSQFISAMTKYANEYYAACTLKTAVNGFQALSATDSLLKSGPVVVNGDMSIDRGTINDAKIIVTGTLTLSGAASCTSSCFLAQRVVIEGGTSEKCLFFSVKPLLVSGGTHNSQMFGMDSMQVSDQATFGPMSLWLLYRKGVADSTAGIKFAPGCRINGTVISCSDTTARRHSRVPSVVFGKGCTLSGICMTDEDIDINGATVYGNLWVRSIVTSDGKKAYVNYLFNTQISGPSRTLPFPLVGSPPVTLYVEKITQRYSFRRSLPIFASADSTSSRKDSTASDTAKK